MLASTKRGAAPLVVAALVLTALVLLPAKPVEESSPRPLTVSQFSGSAGALSEQLTVATFRGSVGTLTDEVNR